MNARAIEILPGLLLLGAVAGLSRLIGGFVPLVSPLVIAIGLGALVGNTVGRPEWARAGLGTHKLLLETAIVLLGVSFSLDAIVRAGPTLAGLVVGLVAFGLVLVEALSRLVGLDGRLGSLLAAGSSICGVSAIAAASPACNAEDGEVAHAAATILLFDAVTIVAFPALGRALNLDPRPFGIWAGLAMFSTGPVAAAGFAYSAVAGRWATITKLTRNALIGVVAGLFSLRYAVGRNGNGRGWSPRQIWADFPKFLVGFLALAALSSAGAIPPAAKAPLATVSDGLFLVAFAGLGFDIRYERMRDAGLRPVAVVGITLLVVGTLAFGLVTWLF
ncbi:MAG: YeiH family protein [Haloferacaceae archaeon]